MTLEEQIQTLTAERDGLIALIDKANSVGYGNAVTIQIERIQAERDAALKARRESEELSRMQLCAVMTASVQNTESTIKDRIDHSNPYWTQAYADVCAAVDREMRERADQDAARKACAQKDEALQFCSQFPLGEDLHYKVCSALDDNTCGKGYVKAESLRCFACDDGHTPLYCLNCAREGYHRDDEWKPVVEALETVLPDAEDYPNSTVVKIKQALAHAEKLISQ